MRLWHENLIPMLPRQQLLGQHRECCALRGNGWGKAHSTVNYVFDYPPASLYNYHFLVIKEMTVRGYKVTEAWLDPFYRGKQSDPWDEVTFGNTTLQNPIYPEHDDTYLKECIENISLKLGQSLDEWRYSK